MEREAVFGGERGESEEEFSLMSDVPSPHMMKSVNEKLAIIKVNVQCILDEILKIETLLKCLD